MAATKAECLPAAGDDSDGAAWHGGILAPALLHQPPDGARQAYCANGGGPLRTRMWAFRRIRM